MRRPKLTGQSGIYCIINHENGNFYVGSSRRLASRWSAHRRALETGKHEGLGMQRAWNKYGPDVFSFEMLEYCEPADLIPREQHYIDTMKPRYNRNMIAGKPPATVYTPERRAAIGARMKGREHTEQTKQRMSEASKGRKKSPEHVEKIRAHAKLQGEKRRGTTHTELTKRRISEAAKRRADSPEGIAHLAQARKNKAKIKPHQIADVWSMKDQGLTYDQIGEVYGVRYWVIGAIIRKGRPATCPDHSESN